MAKMWTGRTDGITDKLADDFNSSIKIDSKMYILSVSELTNAEDAISIIADYYDGAGSVPREVMLDFELSEDDVSLLSEYLSLETKYKVAVKTPSRGDGRALCDLALENAKEAARQHRLTAEREDKDVSRLAELLALAEPPKRIEAYDISNIGDENIVASMIVYEDGKLKKSDYRLFNIKTTGGRDDYGSMREALSRRLSHLGDTSASLSTVPDLILLDGGVGQVGAVREILENKGLDIPLFGMVKDDYHKTRAITDGTREISISHELNVYAFVYKIQEEAHRFAVKASGGGKIKTMTKSTLEKIEGIGPKKAKILLSERKISELRKMSEAEIASIKGISDKDAKNIYKYYHKSED